MARLTLIKKQEKGFTLIEVAVAIALLGLGLVTLTALTTRLMNDTQEEVNRSRASLLAQYILEINLSNRFNGGAGSGNNSQNGELYSKLQELEYFNGLPDSESFNYLKGWEYNLTIEPLSLPLTEAAFEKYIMTISWGKSYGQEFTIETIKKAKDTGQSAEPNPQDESGGGDGDDL